MHGLERCSILASGKGAPIGQTLNVLAGGDRRGSRVWKLKQGIHVYNPLGSGARRIRAHAAG